ncbi:hypothetical protein BH10BAC2_BH10BAC2_08130 [soil metagenome]
MKTPADTLNLLLITLSFFCIPSAQLFSQNNFIDSLNKAIQQESNPVKKIELFYSLGEQYKTPNIDSAIVFYTKGLNEAISLRHDSLTGIGYYYLALQQAHKNNYRPAWTYTDSAFKYLQYANNYQQLAAIKQIKNFIYLKYLRAETKQTKSDIKKQQRTSNILFSTVVIIILFSGLLFNRYQLKNKIENQQALLGERKRISHELHDDLGSQLCTAKLFLTNLKNNGDIKDNHILLENSLSLVEASIKDLRFIMDDLQTPSLLEHGYIAATEELVHKINQLKHINFSLSCNGVRERLESKKENNLFRITQELINNTLKYAHAKNVTIDVLKRNNNIVLMYEDDGNGCNLQSAQKGYGLNNIYSRSQSLGGTVAFDSFPGAGFRAIVEIPLLYA